MIEIKIIGRGGQGGKTAAAILAKIALSEGKEIQSFPAYGAERQGAPVFAYTRISNKPIRIHSGITQPNIVAVIDPTLLSPSVIEGVPADGIIVVNTSKTPGEVRKIMGFKKGQVYTVDATNISIDKFGKNIPNTPMLGAINKAAKLFDQKLIENEITKKFGKKLSRDILHKNIEAIRDAAEQLQNG